MKFLDLYSSNSTYEEVYDKGRYKAFFQSSQILVWHCQSYLYKSYLIYKNVSILQWSNNFGNDIDITLHLWCYMLHDSFIYIIHEIVIICPSDLTKTLYTISSYRLLKVYPLSMNTCLTWPRPKFLALDPTYFSLYQIITERSYCASYCMLFTRH